MFFAHAYHILSDWIPASYNFDRFFRERYASVLKSISACLVQPFHADKEPDRNGNGLSALFNLSFWPCWVACLTNSSRAVKFLVDHFRNYKAKFDNTFLAACKARFSAARLAISFYNKKLEIAWQWHLHFYVQANPALFPAMEYVNFELSPFMFKIFDLDHVHAGGAYPGRVRLSLRTPVEKGKVQTRKMYPLVQNIQKNQTRKRSRDWVYSYGKVHFRSAF